MRGDGTGGERGLGEAPTEPAEASNEAAVSPTDPAGADAEPMAGLRPSIPVGAPLARARMFAKVFGEASEDSTVQSFGRFRVLEPLGAGGMGVVSEAYDPKIARGVALKVVKVTAENRDSALVEAQALGRLSHPNVVPIFDVGVERDFVYIVMELVRGKTLLDWVDGRSAREILDAYRQAGLALAAAHAAGLVHRDFKPANAIMGDDGRVRVVDFGLACAAEDPDREPGQPRLRAGTRYYMAPEIAAGAAVTPAADQYSFCVALDEALSHASSPVPRRAAALLDRGRAPRPADRFASMTALLHELARDPARTWRRAVAAIGAVVAVSAAMHLVLDRAGRSELDPCAGGAAKIAQVWGADERAAALARIAQLDPYGAALRPLLASELDRHRVSWVEAYHGACVDQRNGIQSTAQIDRRNACLARSTDGLAVVRELVARIEPGELEQLPRAVQSLDDPARCSSSDTLLSNVEPPRPAVADAVAELRHRVARARIEVGAGRFGDALMEARFAAYAARGIDYPPVLAEALLVQGHARMSLADRGAAVPILREATSVALAANDDALAVEAWARRAWAEGTSSDPGGAMAGLEVIEAIARRSGAAFARALLYNNVGSVELARGHRDRARDDFALAVVASRGVTGGRALELMAILTNIGVSSDDPAQSDELFAEVVAARSGLLGPEHPDTLGAQWTRVGMTVRNLQVAAEMLLPVCRGYEQHPALTDRAVECWTELGLVHRDLGDRGGAIEALQRAVASRPDAGQAAGWLALLQGDGRAAAQRFVRALADLPAPTSRESWALLPRWSLLTGLGSARRATDELAGAREALAEAIAGLAEFARTHAAAMYERQLGRARVEQAVVLAKLRADPAAREAAAATAVEWLQRVGGYSDEVARLTARTEESAR